MELSSENIEAYRMARWRLKCATIAAAMARGWPESHGADTELYRECLGRLEGARAELARFPAEWAELLAESEQVDKAFTGNGVGEGPNECRVAN